MSVIEVAECHTAADVMRLARESEARRREGYKPRLVAKQPESPPVPTYREANEIIGTLALRVAFLEKMINRICGEFAIAMNPEEKVDVSIAEIIRAVANHY